MDSQFRLYFIKDFLRIRFWKSFWWNKNEMFIWIRRLHFGLTTFPFTFHTHTHTFVCAWVVSRNYDRHFQFLFINLWEFSMYGYCYTLLIQVYIIKLTDRPYTMQLEENSNPVKLSLWIHFGEEYFYTLRQIRWLHMFNLRLKNSLPYL